MSSSIDSSKLGTDRGFTLVELLVTISIFLIVTAVTDNSNRTTNEIKHLLSKNNGKLGEQGSAMWAFEKKEGVWTAQSTTVVSPSERDLLLNLVEALEEHDDIQSVYTNAE